MSRDESVCKFVWMYNVFVEKRLFVTEWGVFTPR